MNITKRELFAGIAMHAMINAHPGKSNDRIARDAIYIADDIIKELSKTENL